MTSIIGNEEEVNVRRTATNTRDHILKMVADSTNCDAIPIFSGSRAEGLRFKSSDEDWMFASKQCIVIPSESYTNLYDTNNKMLLSVLMMENEMTKPGFTLLRQVYINGQHTHLTFGGVTPIIKTQNGCYFSSKKWREMYTSNKGHKHTVFNHGPCTSFELGNTEYDHANCLKCDFWPASAQSTIHRLHKCSWPSPNILHSVVSDGVLFVPIGAKQSIFEDIEWRMSFSLAEKRLIYFMNHTQFLCYALLKLFLKEAIDGNEDVKGLLCSYFLKTAVFWEITASPNNWNPSSLLSYFWKCFCRLLQWVSSSYCPNFFIPENNMFRGKIEGTNQCKLLQHLNTLYKEGYRCLLRCLSLNYTNDLQYTFLSDVLNGLEWDIERVKCRACVLKTIIIEELHSSPLRSICFLHDTEALCLQLHSAMQTSKSSLERYLTRKWLHKSLTDLCLTSSSPTSSHGTRCNRSYFKHHTQRMRILNRCRIDSACCYLYQATECYNIGKYSQILKLAKRSKKAIFLQGSIYRDKIPHTECSEIGEDLTIQVETMMRKSYIEPMTFPEIPEFYIEIFCTRPLQEFSLPPAIYALFLQYLYYSKQGNQQMCEEFLYKIFQMTLHPDGFHIDEDNLPTSWHILGICQQMSGDNQAAFRSFSMAQRKELYSYKIATYVRLGTILAKYFSAQRQILACCYSLIKSHHNGNNDEKKENSSSSD